MAKEKAKGNFRGPKSNGLLIGGADGKARLKLEETEEKIQGTHPSGPFSTAGPGMGGGETIWNSWRSKQYRGIPVFLQGAPPPNSKWIPLAGPKAGLTLVMLNRLRILFTVADTSWGDSVAGALRAPSENPPYLV